MMPDPLSERYEDLLDGTYDCVDRIVLNAYFELAQSGGGFRVWWRRLFGTDENLDDTHVMRFAARFARRVHAWAEKHDIPVLGAKAGERKHKKVEDYLPLDSDSRGIFCIVVGRAPAPLRQVQRSGKGGINVARKAPLPYANFYHFHLMDPEWGHVIVRFCPHPPFHANVILNGHEYVARQAVKQMIPFRQEGNCFTCVADLAGLGAIADTMSAPSAVGRLVQVGERWLYSACLCFALSLEEQERSGFRYKYSVYQAEYCRNLLFHHGRHLEVILNDVIDHTRRHLDLKTLKTIFGRKRRPYFRHSDRNPPRFEVVVERPDYDLTVFKIHFGRLTVKLYSKGECVLRAEAIAHNTKDLRCGCGIDKFPDIVSALQAMLDRFLSVLRCLDACFVDADTLDALPLASTFGSVRVGGVDLNKRRMQAVMEALIPLAVKPRGFQASELAVRVAELLGPEGQSYGPRQAAYDLKKLRAKGLIHKIDRSRRYEAPAEGLRQMAAMIVLRTKVLRPLLANAGKLSTAPAGKHPDVFNEHYKLIQRNTQKLFELLGIAA